MALPEAAITAVFDSDSHGSEWAVSARFSYEAMTYDSGSGVVAPSLSVIWLSADRRRNKKRQVVCSCSIRGTSLIAPRIRKPVWLRPSNPLAYGLGMAPELGVHAF